MDIGTVFTQYLPAPIFFIVILVVQLKIIHTLRSQTSMMMFYGRQIEEIRKMLAGGPQSRRPVDIRPDEQGLYEVLRE